MVTACQAYYWLQPPPRLHGSGGEGGDSHDANDSGGAVRRRALLTPSQAHTSTGVREQPGCAQDRFPRRRVRSASSSASRSVLLRHAQHQPPAATVAAGVTWCPSGDLGGRGCGGTARARPRGGGIVSIRFDVVFVCLHSALTGGDAREFRSCRASSAALRCS